LLALVPILILLEVSDDIKKTKGGEEGNQPIEIG
jgi:hypothetical protein